MFAIAAYALGGYIALNQVRLKNSVMRISITVPNEKYLHLADHLVSVYTSNSKVLKHGLGLTTSILGDYGIFDVTSERKSVMNNTIEVTVFIKHRGTLEWSIRGFTDQLKDSIITCCILNK
jgi:hypothetical protein